MTLRKYTIISFLIVQSLLIKGTNQYKDYLIVNKDTFLIESPIDNISDSVFTNFWYKSLTKQNCISSACWRGAICTWIIKNDSLYLIKMKSCCDDKEINLSILKTNKKQIFANWIDGTIEYPSGKRICTNIFIEYMIYGNTNDEFVFEFDNILQIKNGLVKFNKYDNRLTNCGKYKDQNEIKAEIDSKINLYTIEENDIGFDMYYYIDKDGHLSNVEIFGVNDSIEIKKIINSLNKVDGLPVYYRYGKIKNDRFQGEFKIIQNNTR